MWFRLIFFLLSRVAMHTNLFVLRVLRGAYILFEIYRKNNIKKQIIYMHCKIFKKINKNKSDKNNSNKLCA